MSHFQAVYVPVGVPTYHMETAQQVFEQSVAAIRSVTDACACPDSILLSTEDVEQFLDKAEPDLVIFQNITFANAAYMETVLHKTDCPVLLWTLPEPAGDGGRLRLNSLTGTYSAANMLHSGARSYEYLLGAPDEEDVRAKLRATLHAADVRKQLHGLNLAQVGEPPEGFAFGSADAEDLRKAFGVGLVNVPAEDLMAAARAVPDEEAAAALAEVQSATVGMDRLPEKNRMDFARLLLVYRKFAADHNVSALTSRCWPDFFTDYGTPVCAVLSLLTDDGIAGSCEGDAIGALSMMLGMRLSGKPVFFGDPVAVSETENTMTFWHCGMAPAGLADPDGGAVIGVHPNRGIGPVMDFGCMPAEHVTVFRLGRQPDGSFRLFLTSGRALKRPKQYQGTSTVVELLSDAGTLVDRTVRDGWEPHFVVAYEDIRTELLALARMLRIPVCEY